MVSVDSKGRVVKQLSDNQEKARQKTFELLSKKALLVDMTRKQFANFPFDVKVTNDVATNYLKADKAYFQVRKFLIDPMVLLPIRSLLNDALLMFCTYTRPWDNVGFRLLPMELWDDFNEQFGKIKDEFEEAVQNFENNYDDYVADAKKALGKAFNPKDYPDKTDVRQLFALEIKTANFPDIDDFRLNLTGEDLLQVEQEATQKYAEVFTKSREDLLKQLNQIQEACESGKYIDKHFVNTTLVIVDKLNFENDEQIDTKLAEVRELVKNSCGLIETSSVDESEDDPDEGMMMIDDDELDDLEEYEID